MLLQSALYYPYIHVRDDAWLKAAALYWKRVDRIVPRDYPTRDSRTVKVLGDELGFIESRRPGAAAVEASRLFLDLLEVRGDELAASLRVQPDRGALREHHDAPVDGGLSPGGSIGYIFAEKLSTELISAMVESGLAVGASDDHGRHRRLSMSVGSANWIGMDSRLAATYMTVLTRLTADHFHLDPVTDVPLAHVAMDAMSVDEVARALLGEGMVSPVARPQTLQQRVAVLAIESVIPRRIGLIDATDIVRFRKRHEDLLGDFQKAVASAAQELRQLPEDVDSAILREHVIEVTRRHLLHPRDELRGALQLFGLETARSLVTLQLPLSASGGVALGALTDPIVGTGAGVGAVLLAYGVNEASRRRELRRRDGAANYLLELESALTPRKALRRQVGFTPRWG
ncbi:DUF6236 family protein [Ornithinimicrobium tianjinense]|nr:DUF6236 family protein [Ornithinimicrobium tianjinense]